MSVNAFATSSSHANQNLNSTELKASASQTPSHSHSDSDNFDKCQQINERQNLNSTLIMNENATASSGSSDENLNRLAEEVVGDKENQPERGDVGFGNWNLIETVALPIGKFFFLLDLFLSLFESKWLYEYKI
jgi:hypothetical protein